MAPRRPPVLGLSAILAFLLHALLLPTAAVQGQSTPLKVIRAALEFRFFGGVTPPTVTTSEMVGLLCQTNTYLTRVLHNFTGDTDFGCTTRDVVWEQWLDADEERPVVAVNFTAHVTYKDEVQVSNLQRLLNSFAPFDPDEYITKYVWMSEPYKQSLFFDVNKIIYDFAILDPPVTVMLGQATNCREDDAEASDLEINSTATSGDSNTTNNSSSTGNSTTDNNESSPSLFLQGNVTITVAPTVANIFNPSPHNDTTAQTPLASNIAEIPVSFPIFNHKGITNPPQVNASGIAQSFPTLVQQIFANHSSPTLSLGDIYIDIIERLPCWPNSTMDDNLLTICHFVEARYHVVLPEENDALMPQVQQDFQTWTETAITEGLYQSLLKEEYPTSPLYIGVPLEADAHNHLDDANNVVTTDVTVDFVISNLDLIIDQESLTRRSGLQTALSFWMEQLLANGAPLNITVSNITTATEAPTAPPTQVPDEVEESEVETPSGASGAGGFLGGLFVGTRSRSGDDDATVHNATLHQADISNVLRVYCGLEAHPDAACFQVSVTYSLNLTGVQEGPYATVAVNKVNNNVRSWTMAALEKDSTFQTFLWQEFPNGFPRLHVGRRNIPVGPTLNNETATNATPAEPPRVVAVETQLFLSNRGNITDPVQVNSSGLGDSFPAFVHELVVNISSGVGLENPLGRIRGRKLQQFVLAPMSLRPKSAMVNRVVPADCGDSEEGWNCHQAYVSYELEVRSDEDLNDVRERYRKATDDVIQDGSYQFVLDREIPDSQLKIGLPDGSTKPEAAASPSSMPPLSSTAEAVLIPVDVIFNTSNWESIVDPDEIIVENSLLASWDVFIREIAASVSTKLENAAGAPFTPLNMAIDRLYYIPCGPGAKPAMICHQTYASYDVHAAPTANPQDIPRQDVRDIYLNATITAISNGNYQNILSRDFPDSDVIIGISIDSSQEPKPMDWWLIALIIWMIICCNLMVCCAYFFLCRKRKDVRPGEANVDEPASICVPDNVVISRTDVNDNSVSWESADDEPSTELVLHTPQPEPPFASNNRTSATVDSREIVALPPTSQPYNNYTLSSPPGSPLLLLPPPPPPPSGRKKRRKRPKNAASKNSRAIVESNAAATDMV